MPSTIPVPAAGVGERPWRQAQRAGSREDRILDRIEVCIPSRLAELTIPTPPDIAAILDRAVREVTLLDADHGPDLGALAGLLIRTESVASSKIEQIDASVEDYARALFGHRANESATAMVAASHGVAGLMSSVDTHLSLRLPDVLTAHSILMREDPLESRHAGRFRDMQNWIGGSDYSPRNAVFVPPPPEMVPELIDDLFGFIARADVPIGLQAAIAHAQFELIHPFTDGNGRIGRMLINATLRARGVTRNVVVPAASVLAARRTEYFASLAQYRNGDAGPVVQLMAKGLLLAAQEASITARRLGVLREEWISRLSRDRSARSSGAPMQLAGYLMGNPVVDADTVHRFLGGSVSRSYSAIERLRATGIIEPLTDRKRNQVWAAREMLDELTELDTRIQRRAQDLDLLSG